MARMIVPRYWGEARLQERRKRRQVTVRRWGWSDEGPAEAQAHAESRAREALDRIFSGGSLLRREPNVAYNGAEGVPIREEIVSVHGETVVTRNGYGALCINTPDVFFADLDFAPPPFRCGLTLLASLATGVAAAVFAPGARLRWALLAAVVTAIAVPLAASLWHRVVRSLQGGDEAQALARVRRWMKRRPGGRARVYRTPAGLRVLVLDRTFDPTSNETAAAFQALGTDPRYASMCRRQHCFRARVSPKPWRAGVPRPKGSGAWPLPAERVQQRAAWVESYDRASQGFASCRFLEALGKGPEAPAAAAVRDLHDRLSRAGTSLPLA